MMVGLKNCNVRVQTESIYISTTLEEPFWTPHWAKLGTEPGSFCVAEYRATICLRPLRAREITLI
mgnify:CR=1 FL=1